MGGSNLLVRTEIRPRDPENDTSIPTPVNSSPSTPTFPSFKRKFEEDPPYLDFSTQVFTNKYQRFEPRYRPQSPQSSRASLSSESSHLSSQDSRSTPQMSFLSGPFNFVFEKITALTAFTGELLSQFKTPPTPPDSHTDADSTQGSTDESTQEPTQEPTPESTPEPTSASSSDVDANPAPAVPVPRPAPPLPDTRPAIASMRARDGSKSKARAFALFADTMARRDAPVKRFSGRWPTATVRENARRVNRVRVANISGSPLESPRARADELRRSQRRRPARINAQFDNGRVRNQPDVASLEAYIASLEAKSDDRFKSLALLQQERAAREEEIRLLRAQRREPIVKPLSEATLAEVREVFARRGGNERLIENDKARVELTVRDIQRLDPSPGAHVHGSNRLWLNDQIIDLYLYMVCEKANAGRPKKRVHAFGVFFWTFLTQRGPKSVEKLTRKAKIAGNNLLDLDLLFIPANFGGNHWTIGVIKPAEKRIEFYDSMGRHNHQEFFQAARRYLINELKDKDDVEIDKPWEQWWGEWTNCEMEDSPKQTNQWDCGVFVCKTAELLARGRELSFTQAQMVDIRHRMAAEILKAELGVE